MCAVSVERTAINIDMTIQINQAQDVWKDVGRSVDFIVLKLKRENLEQDQEQIADFSDRSQAILRSMQIRADNADLRMSIGFSYAAWTYLFPNANVPSELESFKGLNGPEYAMPATDGDVFIHVRAKEEAVVYETVSQLMQFLSPIAEVIDETKGFRYFEGRAIIGFIDGTEAPSAVDAAEYALIGEEDSEFENGSYAFAQKWIHDMNFWKSLSTDTQEKAVGRQKFTDLELDDDDKFANAHNVASKLEIDEKEQKIVRMNVPFSDLNTKQVGTYFIGYARHWEVTKGMLNQMLEKSDYLLTFSQIVSGQLFFIPSRPMLDNIASGELF